MKPVERRVLTALLLLAVFVPAVLWAPAWLWGILMAGVVALGALEWAHLSHFGPRAARVYASALGFVAIVAPSLLAGHWSSVQLGLIALAVAFWLLIAPLWLAGQWRVPQPGLRAVVGAAVLLPTWAALLELHARGPTVLLGVMAIVWIADSAAYFAGRAFGRHKLAPLISPGKTWEGVGGALAALVVYAGLLSVYAGLPLVALLLTLSGLLYLSILGDLFESWIKRVADTKDSGSLLPGHGGVLDRIDALTATLPVAAGMLIWLERGA